MAKAQNPAKFLRSLHNLAEHFDLDRIRNNIITRNCVELVRDMSMLQSLYQLMQMEQNEQGSGQMELFGFRGHLPRIEFYLLTQRLTEMCLSPIIDCLADLPVPTKTDWARAERMTRALNHCHPKTKCKNPMCLFVSYCSILELSLLNKAAIRYAKSRQEEFVPRLLAALKTCAPLPTAAIALCIPMTLCLMDDEKSQMASDLVVKHRIFDTLADILETLGESTKDYENVFTSFFTLCSPLIGMGGPDVKEALKSHRLIEAFTKRSSTNYEFRMLFRLFCTDLDGKTKRMRSIPLSERINTYVNLDYRVYCSSRTCRTEMNADGLLRYCSLCKLARYCGTACQARHWKKENHKTECIGNTRDMKPKKSKAHHEGSGKSTSDNDDRVLD